MLLCSIKLLWNPLDGSGLNVDKCLEEIKLQQPWNYLIKGFCVFFVVSLNFFLNSTPRPKENMFSKFSIKYIAGPCEDCTMYTVHI